jgi:hypothetical protein
MGSKILYGLVVLGSPLHMRDPHGRHDAEENGTFFLSFFAVLQSSRLCYALLNLPSCWERYENDLVVFVGVGEVRELIPPPPT